ncbi:MAG: hypothetical protein R3F55_09095 [Alphaproteobacteria bacterium]
MTKPMSAAAAILAAILALLTAAPEAEALIRRPADNTSVGQCERDTFGGNASNGCGGLLCWCCYSDGCWICNNLTVAPAGTQEDCVWDPAYSASHLPSSRANLPGANAPQLETVPGTTLPTLTAPGGGTTSQ